MRKFIGAAGFALLGLIAAPAWAAPCAGFTDVDDTSPFCVNVTWLKNRGVTLGCTSTTLFCPGDFVSRLQMAIFMNRLGDSLFPLTCAAGQVMKWDGLQWACANDAIGGGGGGGTVTSVAAGTGLQGSPNPITGAGSLNLAPGYQLPQACANGQVPKSNGTGGWACGTDSAGTGTVTSVTAGTGLTGGTITASGTIAVNTTTIQTRVTGTCAAGSSIRTIAADGSVTCQADSSGPANAFVQGGNAFGAIATLGATDNQAVRIVSNGTRVLQLQSVSNLGWTNTVNVLAGSPLNQVSGGVFGATIAGGGGTFSPNDYPNRVQSLYGTISGGYNNVASGLSATVTGGFNNTASGNSSIVSGSTNTASGAFSTVSGGLNNASTGMNSTAAGGTANCAGGDNSWAGGAGAVVRPRAGLAAGALGLGCQGVPDAGNTTGDSGSFVWAGNDNPLLFAGLISSGPGQFLVRAPGGFAVNGNEIPGGVELSIFGLSCCGGEYANLFMRQADPDRGGYLISVGGGTSNANDASFYLDQYKPSGTNSGQIRRLFIDDAGRLALNRGNASILTVPFAVGTDGSTGNSAYLSPGGAWTNGSSRTFKEDFAAVDGTSVLAKVLAMPITTWRYRDSNEGRHMGPIAEDFAAAFGLGDGDRYIGTVDGIGVALAAIQGLGARMDTEIAAKDARIAALEAQLALQADAMTAQQREIAELRRAVDVMLTRTSPDGKLAAR